MSDDGLPTLLDAVHAVASIVSNPKLWDKRMAEMHEASAAAVEARNVAAASEHAALEHRDIAEKLLAEATAKEEAAKRWAEQLDQEKNDLAEREGKVNDREVELKKLADDLHNRESKLGEFANTLDHLKDEIALREQAAQAKLVAAQQLLASYDEAKHKAALKLAS